MQAGSNRNPAKGNVSITSEALDLQLGFIRRERREPPKASCGKAVGWVVGMVTPPPRTCLSSLSQVDR